MDLDTEEGVMKAVASMHPSMALDVILTVADWILKLVGGHIQNVKTVIGAQMSADDVTKMDKSLIRIAKMQAGLEKSKATRNYTFVFLARVMGNVVEMFGGSPWILLSYGLNPFVVKSMHAEDNGLGMNVAWCKLSWLQAAFFRFHSAFAKENSSVEHCREFVVASGAEDSTGIDVNEWTLALWTMCSSTEGGSDWFPVCLQLLRKYVCANAKTQEEIANFETNICGMASMLANVQAGKMAPDQALRSLVASAATSGLSGALGGGGQPNTQ